jgi:ATP-dependent DNA helicase DinG
MFSNQGPIATAMDGRYRIRPSQIEMAKAVEQCIDRQGVLLAEAGTGTGKTLAYLIPVILSGKRAVISTGTKNLQEQIFFKDLRFLEKVFSRSLNAVYLKGQDNYLCKRRYAEFVRSPAVLAMSPSRVEALREWANTTKTGDRMEISDLGDDDPIWFEVSSTKDTRIGQKCPFFDECFVTKARKTALVADIVVVNHHLYFADAAVRTSGGGALLPAHDILVFDEAHAVEDTAVEFFSLNVSSAQVERLIRDAMKSVRAAALRDDPSESARVKFASEAEKACGTFFAGFQGDEGRTGFVPEDISSSQVQDYFRLDASLDALENSLLALEGRDEAVDHSATRIKETRDDLAALITESASGFVSWMELKKRKVVIGRSPIDISPSLRDNVFFKVPSVVMTSATLSTDGDFRFLKSRVGIDFDVMELTVSSPFDYKKQACLFMPPDIADPREILFADQAAEIAAELIALTEGGALILCTSFRHMSTIHRLLKGRVPGKLLLQGDAPKTRLLSEFAERDDNTLVATAGFWQGVDLPGAVLRLVIIDKLPFASPRDPLEAARIVQLENLGKRPFIDYQVPRAALLLKQGFGRLIRTEEDRGIVAVLDRRLSTMGYAAVFLRSLPSCPKFQIFDEVRQWWTDPIN